MGTTAKTLTAPSLKIKQKFPSLPGFSFTHNLGGVKHASSSVAANLKDPCQVVSIGAKDFESQPIG
jgi:hypothetical protein